MIPLRMILVASGSVVSIPQFQEALSAFELMHPKDLLEAYGRLRQVVPHRLVAFRGLAWAASTTGVVIACGGSHRRIPSRQSTYS